MLGGSVEVGGHAITSCNREKTTWNRYEASPSCLRSLYVNADSCVVSSRSEHELNADARGVDRKSRESCGNMMDTASRRAAFFGVWIFVTYKRYTTAIWLQELR